MRARPRILVLFAVLLAGATGASAQVGPPIYPLSFSNPGARSLGIGGAGTSSNEVSGLSFLSFVYPGKKWSLAVYRHQLANFELDWQQIQLRPLAIEASGIVWHKVQIDLAADFSDLVDTASVSTIYSF